MMHKLHDDMIERRGGKESKEKTESEGGEEEMDLNIYISE